MRNYNCDTENMYEWAGARSTDCIEDENKPSYKDGNAASTGKFSHLRIRMAIMMKLPGPYPVVNFESNHLVTKS